MQILLFLEEERLKRSLPDSAELRLKVKDRIEIRKKIRIRMKTVFEKHDEIVVLVEHAIVSFYS